MSFKNLSLVALFVSLAACSSNKEPNVELIQDMMVTPAMKAQREDRNSPTGTVMRVPPEGAVARGFPPYAYAGKPDVAEKTLVNPLSGDKDSILRGQQLFETYCFVCHGKGLDGKGLVAAKFSVPVPSLLSDKVRNFKDGRIFHIITDGQGVMSSYASQVKSVKDRWAIVNYIRSRQK